MKKRRSEPSPRPWKIPFRIRTPGGWSWAKRTGQCGMVRAVRGGGLGSGGGRAGQCRVPGSAGGVPGSAEEARPLGVKCSFGTVGSQGLARQRRECGAGLHVSPSAINDAHDPRSHLRCWKNVPGWCSGKQTRQCMEEEGSDPHGHSVGWVWHHTAWRKTSRLPATTWSLTSSLIASHTHIHTQVIRAASAPQGPLCLPQAICTGCLLRWKLSCHTAALMASLTWERASPYCRPSPSSTLRLCPSEPITSSGCVCAAGLPADTWILWKQEPCLSYSYLCLPDPNSARKMAGMQILKWLKKNQWVFF